MAIGPFTTYAPPGVYTSTTVEPLAGQQLAGVRVPVIIGTARETLSQTAFEMVRGSSSQADTPIFGEDVSNRWVQSGPNNNPVLGPNDGNKTKFRVRNYPIVDGNGTGKTTFDSSKVSVSVNGSPSAVSAVDGANGIITLLIPPAATDFVTVNYYFHRRDTRITDDVSDQVSNGPAVLISPKAETYAVTSASNTLVVFVNNAPLPSTITLAVGPARAAVDVASDINAAAIAGLTASTVLDNQGLVHVFLTAAGNVTIGDGTANGVFGFTVGNTTGRNRSFRVYNGPIVDGSDGGITTTDPSKVVVKVNNIQVLAAAVDGANRLVTLPAAPAAGSTVTVEYWFNSWQDTFDYLPNSNVTEVSSVGISPGTTSYVNGLDYIVVNDGDQSKIQWGTSFTVSAGIQTGGTVWNSSQIVGTLVDDRIYGVELTRFTDPGTFSVVTTKFVLPLTPTSGNGLNSPLSPSVFNSVTNGRLDLPTFNPNLITAYVGKTWRDAYAKGPVEVTELDGATNVVTLRSPVPADYKVFASFWYNRIQDDTYTFTVVTPGPTGVGQYTIDSEVGGGAVYGVKFGTKTALPQTIQWPSGVETNPDAFIFGGNPVPETVTVTFSNALQPARNASITNDNAGPYDVYNASRIFGDVTVDGLAPLNVDLTVPFAAVLYSQPVDSSVAPLVSDRLSFNIDGVDVTVDISTATSVDAGPPSIVSLLNADINFSAVATASSVSYGSQVILVITGATVIPDETTYQASNVTVKIPTGVGETDASTLVGLSPNQTVSGSYNAINQAAKLFGTVDAPYNIVASVNDKFELNVDGVSFQTTLPAGSAVTLNDVVVAINDSFLPFASTNAVNLILPSLVALANDVRSQYNTHTVDVATLHVNAGVTEPTPAATNLSTLITLCNALKLTLNTHFLDGGLGNVHQTADTTNAVTAANATDLQSVVVLLRDIQNHYNDHLDQLAIHGFDDTSNVVTLNTVGAGSPGIAMTWALGVATMTTTINHGLTAGVDSIYFPPGSTGDPNLDGLSFAVTNVPAGNQIDFSVGVDVTGSFGAYKDTQAVFAVINSISTEYNAHRIEPGVHVVNDTVNNTNTLLPAATSLVSANNLANALQLDFNNHRTGSVLGSSIHGVNDTTNVVTAAPATTFTTLVALVEDIAFNSLGNYNDHRTQTQGGFHVHSTNDTANVSTLAVTELVARTGNNLYANQLVLSSLVNTPDSNLRVFTNVAASASTTLGFVTNARSSRVQPTASAIATALDADAGFSAVAAAWPVTVPGLGTYLRIDSLTSGLTSSLSFSSTADTIFVPTTNIGITPGVTGDVGENSVVGYTVSSSNPSGSSGTGVVGTTYTDAQTGLRFSILPATSGDYANGGSFTMFVNDTFTCDSAIPIHAIPGVDLTVFNTVSTSPDTTALVRTYKRTGNEPGTGAVYYISYLYGKTTFDTGLYQDLKKIQQAFGPPNPDYPLSLAARLAILNGAVLVGLKQVLKDPITGNATVGSYLAAIDEQKKPITGSVKADVITTLGTDPRIFAYLNQHCLFMSSPRQEGERTAIIGTAIGTTPTGVQAIARGLQSELVTLVYPDSFVLTIQDDAGNLTDRLIDGTYIAAALAGSTCSPAIDVATPFTRRQLLGFKSIGRVLDPTVANQVAVAGVTVIEQLDTNIRVRHGLTTRLDNVITRTPSVQLTIQYVQQILRATLDPFIGTKFISTIPKQVEQAVSAAFQRMINAQIVTNVAGIVASVDAEDPTVLRLEAIYVPVFPLEYIVTSLSVRVRA